MTAIVKTIVEDEEVPNFSEDSDEEEEVKKATDLVFSVSLV
jgi:hypothetical protein